MRTRMNKVWRSTADWVTEDKCRLDDYLNAAKAAAAAQRAVIHQVRGSPVLLSLGGDNSGQSDKNLGVEGQGGERNMAWGLTCSGDSNGDDGQIWAGRSEKELLKVPRSTLQSAQVCDSTKRKFQELFSIYNKSWCLNRAYSVFAKIKKINCVSFFFRSTCCVRSTRRIRGSARIFWKSRKGLHHSYIVSEPVKISRVTVYFHRNLSYVRK